MRKIYFIFVLVLISTFSFAQEKSDSVKIVKMAVFPGCENYGGTNNLIKCFQSKLSQEILKFLDAQFKQTHSPKEILSAKVEFTVDSLGHIENPKIIEGDKDFGYEALRTFHKVSKYLKKKNKIIQPALDSNGNKRNIILHQSVIIENPDYIDDFAIFLAIDKGYTLKQIEKEFEKENFSFNEKYYKKLIKREKKARK